MEPASVFTQLFPCFVTSLKSYFLITTACLILLPGFCMLLSLFPGTADL